MNSQKDYYNILGIPKNSSQDDIKKAYRKLSLKHHPDRGGNKSTFQNINEAFQTLGEPQKRKQYDMRDSFPFSGMGGNDDLDGFFSAVFGGGHPGMFTPFGGQGRGMPNIRIFQNGRPVHLSQRKPQQINKTIEISLTQSYLGANIPITIERWIFHHNEKRTEKEKIYINIEKGIDNGEIIILKNKGNVINETNKGDVKIFISVKNESNFVRKGLDLYLTKEITLKESLVGFKFEIKHLNNKLYKINNEEGNIIPPDYIKKISNLGMIRKNTSGDLYIKFVINFPKHLSSEKIAMLKDIL